MNFVYVRFLLSFSSFLATTILTCAPPLHYTIHVFHDVVVWKVKTSAARLLATSLAAASIASKAMRPVVCPFFYCPFPTLHLCSKEFSNKLAVFMLIFLFFWDNCWNGLTLKILLDAWYVLRVNLSFRLYI